jgi:uncharacterized protein (DUF305 family)
VKVGPPRSGAEPASEERPPSRRLTEPPVLLALAAILVGVVSVVLLLVPRPPGEDSPEAGFARDMEIHHAQAVRMAEVVRDRTEDPAVRILATDIVLTQQAEIGQMRGWLEAWGLPASSSEPPMAWMGHPQGTGPMPGMATSEDLARLQQASPEEADEQFLRLMIPHHQAAVAMSEAVLERGGRPEVLRFAQRTATEQQEEIRGMQALLQRKGYSPEEGSEPYFGPEEHASHENTHLSDALRNAAPLSALPLAVLAIAWLGFDAVRRRRAWTGRTAPIAPSPAWRAVAVGGLFASAAFHAGLAPAHFEEAISYGAFFCAASAGSAIVAGAILAWPSRAAYLTGVVLSLVLIVLWAIFRIVPPPGAEAAEAVGLVGLLTKAAELAALVSCTVLWFRAGHARRREVGADEPLV